MGEIHERRQYQICYDAASILATLCAGSVAKVIDELTGYLWDEEEADQIKQCKPASSSPDMDASAIE